MSKEQFHTLIDFDWTLSDTTASSQDLWKLLANRSGRAYEDVERDGQSFHPDPRLGGYGYEQHIAAYGLDSHEMWAELGELLESSNYLYDDALPFMKGLITSGKQPEILSFGEDRFQRAKIAPLVGQLSLKTGVIIPVTTTMQPKGELIAAQYPNSRGLLVDDKDNQRLPDGWTEVHLNRASGITEPQETATGFMVADLYQARAVIDSLAK